MSELSRDPAAVQGDNDTRHNDEMKCVSIQIHTTQHKASISGTGGSLNTHFIGFDKPLTGLKEWLWGLRLLRH